MKVDIVCFTGNSGLTDYSVSLARALNKITPTTLITSTALSDTFKTFGFNVRLDFRRSRHYLFDIFKFLINSIRNQSEIVNFQSQLKFPLVEGILVSILKMVGIRTILTVHDVLPHYPRPWSRIEYSWFYKKFDRLIVHSDAAKSALRSLGVTAPLLTVPHGVYDIFRLKSPSRVEARSALDAKLSEDDFTILFFGHLEPRKGLVEFIEVARKMQNEKNFKFIIAGGNDMAKHGEEYGRLLEQAKDFQNVVVHDTRVSFEAVENYFCASDLVALPYREGTTSGVLKLAMAFGTPVVASRVGDLPEEIPEGAGILFDADEKIAISLESAIREAQKQSNQMKMAMKQATDGSDWNGIAQKYYNFISNGLIL
jgi:glycosyltransferase involved in cell wall biosynthesis